MYTLYYSAGACSRAIHIVLNELGVPFEIKDASIPEGKNKSPEFLKVNPRGNVPVLVDGDTVVREGAAILLYLLEKHPNALLPKSGKERTQAIEWMMFANATVHPAYSKIFWAKTFEDKAVQQAVNEAAVKAVEKLWKEVDARLANQPYLTGENISPADILLTVFSGWNGYFPVQPVVGENARRMIARVMERDSFKKAVQSETAQSKAA